MKELKITQSVFLDRPSENHLFPTFSANQREPLAATKDQSATLAPGCTGLFFYWVYYSVAVQFEKRQLEATVGHFATRGEDRTTEKGKLHGLAEGL